MDDSIVIALSARWHACAARTNWILDHGFALEYTPGVDALELVPAHVDPLIAAGVPVRFHAFFPEHDIGQIDAERAAQGLRAQIAAFEALAGRGERVITCHIGLKHADPVDPAIALDNLGRLVERGRQLGLTVSLENLRRGPTADPERVASWAAQAGAAITLDMGHAVSSARVQRGELTLLAFVDLFADRLVEVHFYGSESDRHYPPQEMSVLGPGVAAALQSGCRWFTIELDDLAEAAATRAMLRAYLARERLPG
jgi:hypothetical protein